MPQPAWYLRGVNGYLQGDGTTTARPRRIKHALVWPNDAHRNKLGRLRDIATGRGPDIYATSNANRSVHASDGPSRFRWSGFPSEDNLDGRLDDANSWLGGLPGARAGRERRPYYDFGQRRYVRKPYAGMWVGASYFPHSQRPSMVVQYPHFNHPTYAGSWNPWGYDPRNWGSNGVSHGRHGSGGYWNPVVDGDGSWGVY